MGKVSGFSLVAFLSFFVITFLLSGCTKKEDNGGAVNEVIDKIGDKIGDQIYGPEEEKWFPEVREHTGHTQSISTEENNGRTYYIIEGDKGKAKVDKMTGEIVEFQKK